MYELTHIQAQSIVDRMMKDIPYNINIMDHTGIIIGSGNKGRIGTLHHGAVEAIKQRENVEINKTNSAKDFFIWLPITYSSRMI